MVMRAWSLLKGANELLGWESDAPGRDTVADQPQLVCDTVASKKNNQNNSFLIINKFIFEIWTTFALHTQ